MSAAATTVLPPAQPPRTALITGATGFLGSTLAHHLLAEGCTVVGLDDLSNSSPDALPLGVPLVRGDVRDPEALAEALGRLGKAPEVVFHLAGLIQVGESVREPARYHSVNAGGTATLVTAALEAGVEAIVQASSAAVLASALGPDDRLDETCPIGPESPYGETKRLAEDTLIAAVDTGRLSGASLRLFNLAGSAYGCAEHHEPETHLIPLALGAAVGVRPPLQLFGDDFPTPDGTPLRDYVHIEDVVAAFLAAARRALARQREGVASYDVFHVGSGVGHSVREVVAMVERVVGRPVPHEIAPRRPGDCAALVADPTLLGRMLGVRPGADLERMVRDAAASHHWLPAE
ncbi:MAG: UDP-glucose 4-epimerase GalE [Pseudomonadota bacterium]|jgi:UDP-glucose-4-epimerase GalE